MKRLLLFLLFTTFFTLTLHAQDAAAVLAKSDAWRNPLDSFSIDVEVTSWKGSSSETSRFRVHGKGSDRSVVEFLAPASEKGKQLLMLRDAMWIYLPSASRPIRISPMQRLMGEASNGDVARSSFSADYRPLRMTAEPGAWLIELEAKDPAMSYRKVLLRIATDTFRPIDAEFFVASGKRLKRAHFRKFDSMAGNRTVSEVEIEDLVRVGRRTTMRYSNLIARKHDDAMFARDAIGKW